MGTHIKPGMQTTIMQQVPWTILNKYAKKFPHRAMYNKQNYSKSTKHVPEISNKNYPKSLNNHAKDVHKMINLSKNELQNALGTRFGPRWLPRQKMIAHRHPWAWVLSSVCESKSIKKSIQKSYVFFDHDFKGILLRFGPHLGALWTSTWSSKAKTRKRENRALV